MSRAFSEYEIKNPIEVLQSESTESFRLVVSRKSVSSMLYQSVTRIAPETQELKLYFVNPELRVVQRCASVKGREIISHEARFLGR